MRSIILICLTLLTFICKAQVVTNQADTVRTIEIIRGNSLREKNVDSTSLQTIAGDVLLREGATLFTCDSAVINSKLNTIEAFGNVHINQGDTLHSYGQYLKYLGNERLAHLEKAVKLTDKKGTLTTEQLDYNLGAGIGTYDNGGKVINGSTVLTSKSGVYYAATKDVFFKYNVVMNNPKYKIRADSLLYNIQTEVATFTGTTHIRSKDFESTTTSGYYNMKTGEALFDKRSTFKDSTRTFIADHTAFDEKSGVAQLEGNAVVKDSASGYVVMGNQIFLNKKTNSFLATRKPVLILQQEHDSTYIAADTLFSEVQRSAKEIKAKPVHQDTLNAADSAAAPPLADSIANHSTPDSSVRNSAVNEDTTTTTREMVKGVKVINTGSKDSTRYFLAYHHVRIFNDSLQSVCDSLFYSGKDSIFRLFQNPVVWSGQSQINGDTIYLYTKNKKAERLYVFDKGMVVSRSKGTFYNQIAGKTLNGYFNEGKINYMRVKGSPAESIYYLQDKDSAFVGMNRASGDVIDIFFGESEVKKVKFINDISGILHPIRQIPDDQKYLKNFSWQDKRRPKNKLELFE